MNVSVGAHGEPTTNTIGWWRSRRAVLSFKLAFLAVATLLALWFRRPDQFLYPAVWVEDGAFNIVDYATHGWLSLLHPIQGYFSLPIKFLHALAQTLSFRWLPEIGFWLSVAFTYGVLATIATAPTTLRLPFICAIATLLIPLDSEVFAVSLYTGWWGSLLALLPLLWREPENPRPIVRYGLIALGGMSSPLIVVLAPFYALRAAILRTRAEYISLGICLAAATAQVVALKLHGRTSLAEPSFNLPLVVEKMFGYFVVGTSTPGLAGALVFFGLAIVLLIVAAWLHERRELGLTFVLIVGALGAAIAASTIRVPIEAIHPKLSGPRYFFYPYILLAWVLVQIAALKQSAYAIAAMLTLAVAGRNALEIAQRRHDRLDWRAEVEQCLYQPVHQMPIHFGGSVANLWGIKLTNDQCRHLVQQSWFDNKLPQ